MFARGSASTSDRLLRIIDLARAAGVEAHVVRFYARVGLIRPARHAANGYRQFLPLDAKRVRFVRRAQTLGFTLSEIREILRRSRQGKTPCPLVRELIVRRLAENHERLNEIRALQQRMQRASEQWRHMPDQVPHGEAICALIDAVADAAPIAHRGGLPRRRT